MNANTLVQSQLSDALLKHGVPEAKVEVLISRNKRYLALRKPNCVDTLLTTLREEVGFSESQVARLVARSNGANFVRLLQCSRRDIASNIALLRREFDLSHAEACSLLTKRTGLIRGPPSGLAERIRVLKSTFKGVDLPTLKSNFLTCPRILHVSSDSLVEKLRFIREAVFPDESASSVESVLVRELSTLLLTPEHLIRSYDRYVKAMGEVRAREYLRENLKRFRLPVVESSQVCLLDCTFAVIFGLFEHFDA